MKQIITGLIILVFAALLTGCSVERYGAAIDSSTKTVKVKDLFLDPSLLGKKVALKGRISSQCGSTGCWFFLQDDTGEVFVNLAPNNMSLPPRINKKAKVTGIVLPVQGELQVVAQGIELR